MDRILISLKKENGTRASSAPALGLNTIIFKHVYWYMQQTQVSVYRTIGLLVLIFAQNIHCGYEAVLMCTHNLSFGAKIRKIGIPRHIPVLWGSRGYTIHRHVFLMKDSHKISDDSIRAVARQRAQLHLAVSTIMANLTRNRNHASLTLYTIRQNN